MDKSQTDGDATVAEIATRHEREYEATGNGVASAPPRSHEEQQQQQQGHAGPDYSDVESTLHQDSNLSTRTQSIAGTEDAVSINSRTRFLPRRLRRRRDSTTSSTSTSTSTLRAEDDTGGPRRSTVPYLDGVHAARNPGGAKPKKTAGRRAFEVACGFVEVLVTPLDINGEKSSMKESSIGRLFKGHQHGEGDAAAGESSRSRTISMPY